jgi:hypothetical protein
VPHADQLQVLSHVRVCVPQLPHACGASELPGAQTPCFVHTVLPHFPVASQVCSPMPQFPHGPVICVVLGMHAVLPPVPLVELDETMPEPA